MCNPTETWEKGLLCFFIVSFRGRVPAVGISILRPAAVLRTANCRAAVDDICGKDDDGDAFDDVTRDSCKQNYTTRRSPDFHEGTYL